jgi:hypothetical protein
MFDDEATGPATETSAASADAVTGNAIARGLTEEAILADIRYFETKVQSGKQQPGTSYERAMQRVYASLLAHRRQVLAAFRDGRPEAWYEYDHVIAN